MALASPGLLGIIRTIDPHHYLTAIPVISSKYGHPGACARLKAVLARQHPEDVEAYVEAKDPACDIVMQGAEAWAAVAGWKPGDSEA